MSKILWKSLLVSPAVLGAILTVSASSAIAAGTEVNVETAQASDLNSAVVSLDASEKPAETVEVAQAAPAPGMTQIRRYGSEGRAKNAESLDQVTSVSQLSDVQPTDWAFQALQSLVERYGCIAGYPDGTYRGNRAMTRYEFAAGLNACMDRVNELIAAGTADLVTKEDLATLQRLQEEFAAELATLRGRVDALEARTAELEANQFSTTTKLVGEAIFAVTSPLNNPRLSPNGVRSDNQVVFQDRVRLSLQTSFTGKDLLVTRLDAGNAGLFNLPGGGSETTQTFNFGNTGNNRVNLGWLAYYLPLGERAQLYIPAYAGLQYDYAPTISPALDNFDGGNGPLSVFGQRNSIYNIGGGSGIGLNYNLNRAFGLSLGYLASNNDNLGSTFGANVPTSGNGLFNGSYSALAQLSFTPNEAFSVGLTYVHGYRRPGTAIFDNGGGPGTIGTTFANSSVISPNAGGLITNSAGTQINSYGASVAFRLSPQFVVNGWANYTSARLINQGDGEIWSYAVGLAFPDLGRRGNLGGIIVGVQPYLSGLKVGGNQVGITNANPIHVEGFYKYQVSDNISITPGVIWIIAPGQNTANDNVVVGTLRTTFTF